MAKDSKEGGELMRTFQMMIDPTKNKKDAAFCQYFKTNTADSKCMYNTANFYIRNTMTGIKKSPEERTHSEIEVLHYVFTGIQRHNNKCMAKIVIYLTLTQKTPSDYVTIFLVT